MQVNREEVKMLALSVGVREAARQLGLNENTVRQWSKRGQWLKPQALPLSVIKQQGNSVTSVTRPSTALANTLSDLEKRTKLSLARSAAHMAVQSEDAPLNQAGNVHKAAQTAALVHKWGQEEGQTAFSLNVLNLGGSVQIGVKADSVDAVAHTHELGEGEETDHA